jgi:hypothetical protein
MTGRASAAHSSYAERAPLVRNATLMHEQLHPATQAASYDTSLCAHAS